MKRLILIDSNALVHRAFHALPPTMRSPDGKPTNAVYGFMAVFLKMLKELKPDYIVATFDLAGPTFRHEEYTEYKAHREKQPDELYAQMEPVKELLRTFGVPVIEKQGIEADDIIGTLAEKIKKDKSIHIIIVTGDLDTLQLVDGKQVTVFTLRKGMTDTIVYDEKAVHERFGFGPEFVTDFKGLKGDPSDNIPGVRGIGDKTAQMLIKEYGTIEELYRKLEDGKLDKKLTKGMLQKLRDGKDMGLFSKKLATIILDADVKFEISDADWKNRANKNLTEKMFRNLGFFSLIKRLPEVFGEIQVGPDKEPDKSQKTNALKPVKKLLHSDSYTIVPLLGADGILEGLVCATEKQEVFQIKNSRDIKKIFFDAQTIIAHDIKPLLKQSRIEMSASFGKFFDTKIAAYLLDPDGRKYEFERIYHSRFHSMPSGNATEKAIQLWQLKERLENELETTRLMQIFREFEMPLIPILTLMECNGIKINVSALKKLQTKVKLQITELEHEIHELAGEPFNINSPQQLSNILFEKLGIKAKVRRTGQGAFSTAAEELEKIRNEHSIVNKIMQYREVAKLQTTYIEPFPRLLGTDGRIHTTYNQTGTGTGRLSSQDPNLQNIPTRSGLGMEFRKAFIPEKGFSLMSFDYSQLELRIIAHIAKDKKMTQAFKEGEDIHTRTAVEIFKVRPEKITKEMRRQAKVLNFGIIYGMGSLGFSRAAGIERDKARKFIDDYFREFSGVAEYMNKTKQQASREGYVETVFGRRRFLPDINSTMPQLKAQSERMAINHPVQGTGADLMKLAMIEINRLLNQDKKNKDDIHILLQVHDELVFEMKKGMEKEYADMIRDTMEKVHIFDVPLVVDVTAGTNWAEMNPVRSLAHAS